MNSPKSPIRILLLFTGLALPVFFIVPHLRVVLAPAEASSELRVYVSAPNKAPFAVEREVVNKIENVLSGIRGVKNIRSVSREGRGEVYLRFERGEDMAARRFEAATALRSLYPDLPEGVGYPEVRGGDDAGRAGRMPALMYTTGGAGTPEEMRKQTEHFFRQALNSVKNVADLQFQGGQEAMISIRYDPKRLAACNIRADHLSRVLQNTFNSYFPGSSRDARGQQLFVRVVPANTSIETVANTVVQNTGGRPIRLKDIAEVRNAVAAPEQHFRINGRNACAVSVSLAPNCNKLYEAGRIRDIIDEAAGRQHDLKVSLAEDQTVFLKTELRKSWVRAGVSLAVLVVLLLLTYRNWRLSVILIFCLSVNIAIAVWVSRMFGLEWHLYSIAGFGVAFGLMIDNAIVMLDSYRRRLNRGIFTALFGATLTTASALLLVFFLPEEQRRHLHDFSLIIVCCLGVSLLTVLFLVPACYDVGVGASPIRPPHGSGLAQKRRLLRRLAVYGKVIGWFSRRSFLFYSAWVLLIGFPFFLLPGKTPEGRWYSQYWNDAYFQGRIRPQMEYWLGGTLRHFVQNLDAETYHRQPESTILWVEAELAPGHTLAQIDDLLKHFERLFARQKGVSRFITRANPGPSGSIEVHFEPGIEKGNFPLQLQKQAENTAQRFSGVRWNIFGRGEGFRNNPFLDNRAEERLLVSGYEYDELAQQVEKLGALLAENKRVQKIELDQPLEYFDKPLPALYLATEAAGLTERRTNFGELVATINQKSGVQYISLKSAERSVTGVIEREGNTRFDVYQLLNEPIDPSGRQMLRVKEIGALEMRASSGAITRENRHYQRLVCYEHIGSYGAGRELKEKVMAQMRREMPLGYSIQDRQGGVRVITNRQFDLLLVLLAANFIICAILFESLRQPFFIITTIPIAFIGVFFAFGWAGFAFDQGGFAAFVLLGGIVVNAAIFVVNDLNKAKGKVRNFQKTLLKTLYRRSGTILLTVASTSCGFIPFLYEGPETPFWFALALGSVAGLLMSVLAVFAVLPVLLWKQ